MSKNPQGKPFDTGETPKSTEQKKSPALRIGEKKKEPVPVVVEDKPPQNQELPKQVITAEKKTHRIQPTSKTQQAPRNNFLGGRAEAKEKPKLASKPEVTGWLHRLDINSDLSDDFLADLIANAEDSSEDTIPRILSPEESKRQREMELQREEMLRRQQAKQPNNTTSNSQTNNNSPKAQVNQPRQANNTTPKQAQDRQPVTRARTGYNPQAVKEKKEELEKRYQGMAKDIENAQQNQSAMMTKPVTEAVNKVNKLIGGTNTTMIEAALNDLQSVMATTNKLVDERLNAYRAKAVENKTLHEQLSKDLARTKKEVGGQFTLAVEREIEKLGPPSTWTPAMANKAASLRARLLFQTGGGKADPTKGAGVNGSWWIQQESGDNTKAQRLFIFKPIDAEDTQTGFENGKSSAREVLGKAIGDGLQNMTGMAFNFPPTFLVPVSNERLPDRDGKVDQKKKGQERLGSLQQLSPAKHGEAKDFLALGPEAAELVSGAAVQAQAVLDAVMLNCDRHSGNLMVDEDNNGSPILVPIDNGLGVPTKKGLYARQRFLGPPHNVISKFPASDRPFDAESLVRISEIDPNKVAALIKDTVKDMASEGGGSRDAVEGVDFDEAAELARRSAEFLKVAAARLTPAELATAYQMSTFDILEAEDRDFEDVIKKAIAQRAATVLLDLDVPNDKKDGVHMDHMAKTLKELGWGPGHGEVFDEWLQKNAALAHRAFENRLPNPVVAKKKQELLDQLGSDYVIPSYVAAQGPNDQIQTLMATLAKKAKAEEDKRVLGTGMNAGLTAKDVETHTGEKGKAKLIAKLAVFEEFGGVEELKKDSSAVKKATGKAPEKLSFEEKVAYAQEAVYKKLGGDDRLLRHKIEVHNKDTASKIQLAKTIVEYESLGGDAAWKKMAGPPDISDLAIRIRAMQLEMREREGAATLGEDPNPPPALTDPPDVQLKYLQGQIDTISRPAFRAVPEATLHGAVQAVTTGDLAGADGLIRRLRKELAAAKKDPAVQLEGVLKDEYYGKLKGYLDTQLQKAKNALEMDLESGPGELEALKQKLQEGKGCYNKVAGLKMKLKAAIDQQGGEGAASPQLIDGLQVCDNAAIFLLNADITGYEIAIGEVEELLSGADNT